MSIIDVFGDDVPLITQNRTQVPASVALASKKVVALYFSAHWCGPCKKFTPVLTSFYNALKARDPDAFEVVFVSSDRNNAAFLEYFGSMPWLALPFNLRDNAGALMDTFFIKSIPSLIIFDSNGGFASRNGIQLITEQGGKFPWGIPILPAGSGDEDVEA